MILLKSKQVPLEFSSEPKPFKKYHKIKHKNTIKSVSVKYGGDSIVLNRNFSFTIKQLLVILKLIKPGLKSNYGSRIYLPLKVDTALTKKPKDIRMGRGKGAVSDKVFNVKAGSIYYSLYNLGGVESNCLIKGCLPKISSAKKIHKSQW